VFLFRTAGKGEGVGDSRASCRLNKGDEALLVVVRHWDKALFEHERKNPARWERRGDRLIQSIEAPCYTEPCAKTTPASKRKEYFFQGEESESR